VLPYSKQLRKLTALETDLMAITGQANGKINSCAKRRQKCLTAHDFRKMLQVWEQQEGIIFLMPQEGRRSAPPEFYRGGGLIKEKIVSGLPLPTICQVLLFYGV
jgi:hypothetical protein